MQFKDVIEQQEAKQQLFCEIKEGRIPHAQLFVGGEGVGAFPAALAFATRMLCENPHGGEACGECLSCRRIKKLQHPDLHFSFPVVKPKGSTRDPESDDNLQEFRNMVIDNPYFGKQTWLKSLNAANQQMKIFTGESKAIHHKFSLKSSLGGYKILIMWLPELMNLTAANRMLKLFEEPPEKSLFLLVSERPETLLSTIVSRMQRIAFIPLSVNGISEVLINKLGINPLDANNLARVANGNYVKALDSLKVDAENVEYLKQFKVVMRYAYSRDIKNLYEWSFKEAASWGRERQKGFLNYFEHLLRENFMHNFGIAELVFENSEELAFSKNFSPFINENNIIPLMNELEIAQRDIEGNVNAKMVFFDLVLKIIIQIKNR